MHVEGFVRTRASEQANTIIMCNNSIQLVCDRSEMQYEVKYETVFLLLHLLCNCTEYGVGYTI